MRRVYTKPWYPEAHLAAARFHHLTGVLVKARAHANGPFFGRVVLCREDIGLLAEHVEVIIEALRRPLAPAK